MTQRSDRAPDPLDPPDPHAPPARAQDATGPLRVAAIADLHVTRGHDGPQRALFAEIAAAADVLLLCGDLTNTGVPEEAERLAADLAGLRIPVGAVLGNHDHHADQVEDVKQILRQANVTFLADEPMRVDGVGFAGAKGFGGGFGRHMLDPFGEEANKKFVGEVVDEALQLEHALHALETPRIVVALHYAPIADTVQGEPPEIFPFLGCSRLAETIDRFDTIAAIFHGHAHHGAPEGHTPRGIPVYNCSMDLVTRAHGRGYIIVEV